MPDPVETGIDPRGLPINGVKVPTNAPEMVKSIKRWFDSAGPTIIMISVIMRFIGRAMDGVGGVLFDLSQLLLTVKLEQGVDRIGAAVDGWGRKPAAPAPPAAPDPTSADTGNVGPPPTTGYRGAR